MKFFITVLIFIMSSILPTNINAQNKDWWPDEDEKFILKDNVGLLVGFLTAVPVGVIGVLAISKNNIDGPNDSILYIDSDQEPFTVSDHNSRNTLGLLAFLACDIVVCPLVGAIIHHSIKDKIAKRTNMSIVLNPINSSYSCKLMLDI